ncbi:MAG TPA: M4 family metallopeptidase [Pyrinomonadaceae bacterium]|nr:M4 family metallopeptidase [Pyrinomonadaceae bacterium]
MRNRRLTWLTLFVMLTLSISLLALLSPSFMSSAEAVRAGAPQAGQQSVQTEALASPGARLALDSLRTATNNQIEAHVARQTGVYSFVRATGSAVLSADNSLLTPEERARAFLAVNGGVVGMTDIERNLALDPSAANTTAASSLQLNKVSSDQIGSTHVRFDQTYEGLKVFGAQLIVHMNSLGITAVNGHYVPGVQVSKTPAVSAARAAATALQQQVGSAPLKLVKTELSIYRTGLLEGYQGQSVLAYSVEVTDGKATRSQIWIDAMKGTVLNRIALNHQALDRIIYTPEYDNDGPFAVRHEGDPFTPGAPPGTTGADPINNLYLFAGHTYNMFSSAFGRDSYNALGHTMHSVLLANDQCPNAYWNGISTNYCPDFDADDVVSHEWGHAYTQFTDNLIYSYQSGALNESYSDIFGETADLLNGVDAEGGSNNTQPPPAGQRWQIGEDVNVFNQPALGILRDMWDPTRYGQPDKTTSANYSCGSGDGGGVHANSGVPNHAYAMLVDGKTFNGQTITGIGWVLFEPPSASTPFKRSAVSPKMSE